jgi:hypothetical protein
MVMFQALIRLTGSAQVVAALSVDEYHDDMRELKAMQRKEREYHYNSEHDLEMDEDSDDSELVHHSVPPVDVLDRSDSDLSSWDGSSNRQRNPVTKKSWISMVLSSTVTEKHMSQKKAFVILDVLDFKGRRSPGLMGRRMLLTSCRPRT